MNMHTYLKRMAPALAMAWFLGATGGIAQERFSTIRGTVKDASGAVVPGVAVTLLHAETGRAITVETTDLGIYIARQLEPGRYRARFEKPGFSRQEVQEIVLRLGNEAGVDVVLEVGSARQAVQVTESAPPIDMSGVTVSSNVTAREFGLLPKARSFQSVVLFSPSVSSGQLEGGYQVNGASGSENQFFVDGISTNSLIDGRSRQNGAFEFLQEVQVKTGGMDAEYGGALGGVISAITRSGGNSFHGEAHYYYGGNALSAGPVKRLLLLNPYSNQGVHPTYQQDYKGQNDTHEPGGSLGGYLLRNHLWFYSSYSPQFLRRSHDYLFGNGVERDTLSQRQSVRQWFNKISWNPGSRVRATFSWLWTPTRTEGTLPAYNGYGNSMTTSRVSAQANKTQGWTQPQSNYGAQVDWTATGTSLLSVRAGRFWDNYRSWGIPPFSSITYQAPATGITGIPESLRQPAGFQNTPRTLNTFYDIATRTYYQVDYSKFLSSALGHHDIKIGGGTQKTVNKMDVTYPGAFVWVFWNTAMQRNDGTSDRGPYGYYEVHDYGTRGSTGGTINNLYIQDHWRVHPRVSASLGLRTENEIVPSFVRSVKDPAFHFGFTQKMSPRAGLSWDITGKGRIKAYGSFGRFYDWVKYDLSRNTFGGALWHVYYRSLDTPDVFSLGNGRMPGRNIWNDGPFEDRRVPSFEEIDPRLKPMTTDLYNAGLEVQVTNATVLHGGWVRNRLVRTIEDTGRIIDGNEVYYFVNPGEGIARQFTPSTATPQFDMPRPKRVYDALEVSLNRRFSGNFFLSANYTWSRLYGNYAGLGNSDEISTPTVGTSMGTTQQYGGSIARPGTNGSRAWDIDQYVFDSRGRFVEGRLATDRPHVFKAYGSYGFKWGSDIGGFFYAGSGTPMSTAVFQIQRVPLFVNGRGDMGRTPTLTQTDLLVGHELKFGEQRRLRFEFNAQNVFNQKTARHVFNWLNRGATSGYRAAAINLGNVNLFQGYDYMRMLNTIKGSGTDPFDPRYGMADLFNAGFAGRIMVKFMF